MNRFHLGFFPVLIKDVFSVTLLVMEKGIEIIARAVIVQNKKVLLCKVKTKENWFFPGGHVEAGEVIKRALERELQEEIGIGIESADFIGINENKFVFQEEEHQEVNIVFEARLKKYDFQCCEDHLEFRWFSLEEMENVLILPDGLKKAVLEWLENGKTFYCYQ